MLLILSSATPEFDAGSRVSPESFLRKKARADPQSDSGPTRLQARMPHTRVNDPGTEGP